MQPQIKNLSGWTSFSSKAGVQFKTTFMQAVS